MRMRRINEHQGNLQTGDMKLNSINCTVRGWKAHVGAMIVTLSLAGAAVAQSGAEHSFDIARQPLADALARFGTQAGIQVSVHGDLVRSVDTPGVSGTMTTADALRQLLSGTGLDYRINEAGAVIMASGSDASGAASMLSPIRVEAASDYGNHYGSADRSRSLYVTNQDLQRRNPANVKDVFAGESGVSVGGAQTLSQKIYVNGVEETQLAVSIDGARQNNKVFHHAGTNIIDPSLLKLVRVDPGVAPADAGPGALAGSIAFETVDVGDVLAPDDSHGGLATVHYNTNGGTVAGGASVFGRSDGFEFLGYAKRAAGDQYEDGAGDEVPGTETDLTSFLVKGAHENTGGHRFEVSAEQVVDDAQRPFRANIGNIPSRPDPDTRRYELTRKNYVASYAMPQAAGLWDPKILFGYAETEISVPKPYGSLGATGSISGKFENDFNYTPDSIVTAGVDFYSDEASYRDPATPEITEQTDNVGIYAQMRLDALDPVQLSLGLRGDHQNFEGVDGSEQDNSGASGNASAVFTANDYLSFNVGYSNVWGGIQLAENYIMNPGWSYSDIDPVRAENYVAGVSVDTGRFTFDASVFQNDFKDVRDESYSGGPSLTTDFESEGFNVGVGAHWRSGFARVSYTDTEITVQGEPADTFVSQYLGTPLGRIMALEAAHRLDTMDLTVGGTVEAALENDDTVKAGGRALEAYEVLNLYAVYQPRGWRRLSLRFEVNNVFDETYADRATYGQDFASVKPLQEPGRSFLIQARLDL